jgi:hypothetical protein
MRHALMTNERRPLCNESPGIYVVRRNVQAEYFLYCVLPRRAANVFSLCAGTTRLAASYCGETRSQISIDLCRRSQIFNPEIDLQKVRKRTFGNPHS